MNHSIRYDDGSRQWAWQAHLGRLQLHVNLLLQRRAGSPDKWIVRPAFIFERKSAT